MAEHFARTLHALREMPWAIKPEVHDAMLEIVESRAAGGRLTADEIAARIGNKDDDGPLAMQKVGPVAVLPLHGVLSQRMNLFSMISGGTSTEMFGALFDQAMADRDVMAIVLDIDSPGGNVAGVEELALKVYKARGAGKPIVGLANSIAASGAYWIGSQAHQFVASHSSEVGSIGVITTLTDRTKLDETIGVKTHVMRIPAGKMMAHPAEPLSDEARASVMARLAPFYDLFVKAVARGRGVTASAVQEGYGQGHVLAAIPARDAGMVDRIETLSEVIARLSSPQGRRAVLHADASRADETTAQEPSPATAQESSPLWREVLRAELDCL